MAGEAVPGLDAARRATVRVCGADQAHVGQGLLLTLHGGDVVVLTCHHVASRLGAEGVHVALRRPDGVFGPPMRARYDPQRSHPGRDAAVLRLDVDPDPARPRPLLHVMEHPQDFAGSLLATGIAYRARTDTFSGRIEAGAMTLEVPAAGGGHLPDTPASYRLPFVYRLVGATDTHEGISGAVVVCERGVLGLAHFAQAEADKKAREAYVVPLTVWAEDWPALHDLIRPLRPGVADPRFLDALRDFSGELQQADAFVGREPVFAELRAFQEGRDRGYVRLVADAGLGKTALAAAIAVRYGAAAFFANASRGLTHPAQCLKHLSVDLVSRYGLDHDHLPERAGEDASFFGQVLGEAVATGRGPVWVVVDALDEADPAGAGNALLLPDRLPAGAYVMVTSRPGAYPLATQPDTPMVERVISWDEPMQQADIDTYVRRRAEQPEIRRTLAGVEPPVELEAFVTRLRAASEGSFMYLAYTLADVAAGEPPDLARLPRGLVGYYARFWSRMEATGKAEGWAEWNGLYRPVIALLGVAGELVSAGWLGDHLGREADEIREMALQPWRRFLAREGRDGAQRWRIVHRSFADFLGSTGDDRPNLDLPAAHRQVARYYLKAYLDDPSR